MIKYTTELAESASLVKSVCDADISVQTELLTEVSDLLSETKTALAKLIEVTDKGGARKKEESSSLRQREVKAAMER